MSYKCTKVINMQHYFTDVRKFSYISIYDDMKIVKDLENRIRKIFSIQEPFCLVLDNVSIPSYEDIAIIHNIKSDNIDVVPLAPVKNGVERRRSQHDLSNIMIETSGEEAFIEPPRKKKKCKDKDKTKNREDLNDISDNEGRKIVENVVNQDRGLNNSRKSAYKSSSLIDVDEIQDSEEVSNVTILENDEKVLKKKKKRRKSILDNAHTDADNFTNVKNLTKHKYSFEEKHNGNIHATPGIIANKTNNINVDSPKSDFREENQEDVSGRILKLKDKKADRSIVIYKNNPMDMDTVQTSEESTVKVKLNDTCNKYPMTTSSVGADTNLNSNENTHLENISKPSFDSEQSFSVGFVTKRKRRRTRRRTKCKLSDTPEKFKASTPAKALSFNNEQSQPKHTRFNSDESASSEDDSSRVNNTTLTNGNTMTEIIKPRIIEPIIKSTSNATYVRTSSENKFCNDMSKFVPSDYPTQENVPDEKQIIAFKILKMADNYEPLISGYIIGEVKNLMDNGALKINILAGLDQCQKPSGKFDLPLEINEDEDEKQEDEFVFNWTDMYEPKSIMKPNIQTSVFPAEENKAEYKVA